jgi:hypothetical protein
LWLLNVSGRLDAPTLQNNNHRRLIGAFGARSGLFGALTMGRIWCCVEVYKKQDYTGCEFKDE